MVSGGGSVIFGMNLSKGRIIKSGLYIFLHSALALVSIRGLCWDEIGGYVPGWGRA